MKAKQKEKGLKGKAPPGGRGVSLPNPETQKKKPRQSRPRPYGYEIRKRAVQLHLEEGITAEAVARELGVAVGTVWEWTKRDRRQGVTGLPDARPGPAPGRVRPRPLRPPPQASVPAPQQGPWA